ncbi:MAG: type IV pilus modification PilV family protein [Gammaproteobacteria bacterium]
MNRFTLRNKNAGVGLIEVLITVVVIAVGLLAIASLQGNLVGGSRDNKTRAEAKALADAKIEQLRDNIIKTGGYDALASSAAPESIGGVTETFNRSWAITNQASPDRKEVTVTVCWPAGACTGNVVVQSEITYDDVGNAAKNLKDAQAPGGMPGGPSTNAESSDEITETKNVADGDPGTFVQDNPDNPNNKIWIRQESRTKAIAAYSCDTLTLSAFENGLLTRRIDHDLVNGNEAIELYEQIAVDIEGTSFAYCIPRIRFNGGVIIPIRGIVHSGATTGNGPNQTYLDVDLFTFNASETGAYCVFKPAAGAKSAPYTCYVGGNCSGFTGTTDDDDVTKCPAGSYAAAIVGPGGWRGKVGLLGVANDSNDSRNVCFQEEFTATAATIDTARNYFSLRNGVNEGINKPYSCHDFLIIDGQSGGTNEQTRTKIHDECVKQADAIGGIMLASKNIRRDIPADEANLFDPVIDISFCAATPGTTYTINGTITGAASAPMVTVTDGSATVDCISTDGTYSCSITSSASSVAINGVYNNQPFSCNVEVASSDTSPAGCALAFVELPQYTITGHIQAPSSAAANAVSIEIQDAGNVIACTNNQDFNGGVGTYTCTVASGSGSVDIHATTTAGFTVLPSSFTSPALPGFTSAIPIPAENDLVVAVAPFFTISGNVSLGDTVDNLDSITLNPTNPAPGGCALAIPNGGWHQGNSYAYNCLVYGGTSSITVTISPGCTTAHGQTPSHRYSMTATGGTQGGLGTLIVDLGDVQANQAGKDVAIAEDSNSPCAWP